MHREAAAMQDPVAQVISYSQQSHRQTLLSNILVLTSQKPQFHVKEHCRLVK